MGLNPVLLEKLNASLAAGPKFSATKREVKLPAVPGKVHAVIGMRRTGKTTYLRQLSDQWRASADPARVVFLGFDDDRLADASAEQLGFLLEEYYRRHPEWRGKKSVWWLLDEIQLVDGWERFVRRILDTERMEIVVSGSSARMLSREVHTSLRGRGMETIIRPFSFREFLRHRKEEPAVRARELVPAERSLVEKRFREYLTEGGFPEAQGLSPQLQVDLLQGYVDVVLFRDVVERYGVTQVAALRWLTRHLLMNPAGGFSVHRLYNDLKAQGLGLAKDALHALVGFLEDAFLIRCVTLASDSERRRNSNPRKAYPVDTGMIGTFDLTGRPNTGHAMETLALHELDRRKAEVGYVRTKDGCEVDFLARFRGGHEELIQVCADLGAPGTWEREFRALTEAAKEYPRSAKRLLTLGYEQIPAKVPRCILVQPMYEWLLDHE